ncbi:MAG TPA: hypothetical protein VKR79_04205 [Gaiellaceae bacterium]|nr:hypothetical protein [Gaiellaceae bacterium]
MRRFVAFTGTVTGAAAVVVALRGLLGGRREQLDVYFADGSFVTFVDGSAEAERLLPLARQVLAAVHQTPSEWPIGE